MSAIESSENKEKLEKLIRAGCQVITPQDGYEIIIPNTGLGKNLLGIVDYFESRGIRISVRGRRAHNDHRRHQ
jgi:hypothetical protein